METDCRTCSMRPAPASGGRPAPGKPFEECPACGAFVARGPFREWSTMPGGVKARILGHGVFVSLLAGSLAGAAWALWATVARGGPTWTGCLAAFGVGLALAGSWKGFLLVEAIQRSQRRMADPMYTARLVEFELERAGARGGGPGR